MPNDPVALHVSARSRENWTNFKIPTTSLISVFKQSNLDPKPKLPQYSNESGDGEDCKSILRHISIVDILLQNYYLPETIFYIIVDQMSPEDIELMMRFVHKEKRRLKLAD